MTFGNAFLTLLVASGRKGCGASLSATPSDISGLFKKKAVIVRKIGKNKSGKMNHPDEVILEVRRLHELKWTKHQILKHLKDHGIECHITSVAAWIDGVNRPHLVATQKTSYLQNVSLRRSF